MTGFFLPFFFSPLFFFFSADTYFNYWGSWFFLLSAITLPSFGSSHLAEPLFCSPRHRTLTRSPRPWLARNSYRQRTTADNYYSAKTFVGEPGGMEEKCITHWGIWENMRVSVIQHCGTSPGQRQVRVDISSDASDQRWPYVWAIAQTSWLSRNEKGDLLQLEEITDNQKQWLKQQQLEEEWKVHVLRVGVNLKVHWLYCLTCHTRVP